MKRCQFAGCIVSSPLVDCRMHPSDESLDLCHEHADIACAMFLELTDLIQIEA